jgi:hypothetical protein
MRSGWFIPDPDADFLPIPDPGVKDPDPGVKDPDPGSGTLIFRHEFIMATQISRKELDLAGCVIDWPPGLRIRTYMRIPDTHIFPDSQY